MKNSLWLWLPRVVVILIILFLGMFSLDIFEMNLGFWDLLMGLFMHNIPSIALLLILLVTWKTPIWAGIAFIVIGILMTIFFKHYMYWERFLIIDLPVLLIGASFLVYEFLVKSKDENTAGDNQ